MIECPICPVIWERFKNYFLDIKKGFTKDFITKNYYKHLFYSLVLTIPTIIFLMHYAHLADTGLLFQTFVGGFGAYGVNFVREWYYGIKYKAPWDWTDLNMGSYGGIIGALIGVLIYSIL